MGEICVTNGIRFRQAETKNLKVLKLLKQDNREAGNIKCRLVIDRFTFFIERSGKTRSVEHKTGTVIERTITKIMKLVEKILK